MAKVYADVALRCDTYLCALCELDGVDLAYCDKCGCHYTIKRCVKTCPKDHKLTLPR